MITYWEGIHFKPALYKCLSAEYSVKQTSDCFHRFFLKTRQIRQQ